MKKLLAILMLLASTAQAQTSKSNDVAVMITSSQLKDPAISFDDEDAISFDFDEDLGYGVSFNHYWSEAFSTEFALHRITADLSVGAEGVPSIDLGELEARPLTAIAQWHFRRASRISPYVGAGLAYVTGSFDGFDDGETEGEATFDFENELTWAVNAGADINITDMFAIVVDGKYVQWEPRAEDDEEDEGLEVSPLMLSAGVRVRF
jgi:outer membrane protein W